MIAEVKDTVPWAYVIINLNGEEIGTFCEKELKKKNKSKKEFRAEKVTKRKGDKLYVKWKVCNSWIDKNDII